MNMDMDMDMDLRGKLTDYFRSILIDTVLGVFVVGRGAGSVLGVGAVGGCRSAAACCKFIGSASLFFE